MNMKASSLLCLLRLIASRLRAWAGMRRAVSSGERGEAHAAELLAKKGYEVIARNWRSPRDRRDEIDLVCRDREVLVFVEVKTRSALALVPGYYAVNKRKKKAVKRACEAYLKLLRVRPRSFRFDVVEVGLSMGGAMHALHFENVPLFTKAFRAG